MTKVGQRHLHGKYSLTCQKVREDLNHPRNVAILVRSDRPVGQLQCGKHDSAGVLNVTLSEDLASHEIAANAFSEVADGILCTSPALRT